MKKILIIDDEFIFRQGLRYLMDWEACGYTIAGEASNGQEGLEAVKSLAPDLILCDVVMPIVDGVEFVRRLRGADAPPVIMLSNYDEFDKVRKAFQYGASDYLLKSRVTKEEILKCLDRFSAPVTGSDRQQPVKNFQSLARQVLDGYAKEPFTELTSYVESRLSGDFYCLLYVDAPQKDFRNEHHFHECLESALSGREFLSAFTSLNHGIALIGLSGREDLDWCGCFLSYLAQHAPHTSSVLSLPFSGLSSLREKLEAMLELSRYSILFDQKLAFYEPEITGCPEEASPFPTELYARCSGQGQWDEARQILLEYLESFKNKAVINPYKFKSMIEHTMYNTLNDARKFSESQGEINRIELKLFKEIDRAIQYDHIYHALNAAFDSLSALCLPPRNTASPIIDALHHFLEENYFRQITLYDAANYLHMNYSYLSAYISQNTEKHFSEHLNEIRIEHAKRLLESSEQSISAISTRIGYADQSYFGKMFKKAVGVTPLQYRNAKAGRKENDAKA